ncbi:hypothetical protein CBL_11191 [Carabus blaptoides fortunei]
MDASNMSRKRKFDDGELSLNDASVSQGSEGVNKNLVKCLVGLTKHIIDVHNNKHEPVINVVEERSSETAVTEHNITTQPHFHIPLTDSLWKNISLLKQQTAELEKIYNTPQTNSSRDSLNQTNYTTIDNTLRANVVQHLSENSANLTEQICNLITMYKSEQSEESVRGIRKCLSKINKKIKSIPLQNDDFFSTLNKSNLSGETNAYLTAAHNLSGKLSVLIKKVSKLRKIYKKRVLNLNKSEPVLKKRKLSNISNNDSIVVDNNNAVENLEIVPNSNQITNNNEIPTGNNERSIESLDKSLLEPYNSNYVNALLDSYATVTNNAKRKRKLKEKRAWSENSRNNKVSVEATVHNDEITDNNEIQDVVIKIESDDDSVEITKVENKNVIEERLKKSAKKKKKSVEHSNENVQECLVNDKENITATVPEESPKKTTKKKKKSVENSNENVQEIVVKNKENIIETVSEEYPKKTTKKKKKSVKNSNEHVQEIVVKNMENSTETVSEEYPKKTTKKKKKSVENSIENAQEIVIKNKENVIETVSEENPKKTVKKKRKPIENSNENEQEIAVKINEHVIETVSEENPKKNAKKKKQFVENTQEILIAANEISLNVNDEKTRRKKQKTKKSNGGLTENILNDILHHICANIVRDNENESPIERHNESDLKKGGKDERNKENISVIKDSDNSEKTTKVKRKKKITTDSRNENKRITREKMPKRSTEYVSDDVSKISVKKKKPKSNKKKWKSVEFIVESSEESNSEIVVQNNDNLLLRQEENENDINRRKNINENRTENNEMKKTHQKKIKSTDIIDEISFTNNETVSEENPKKKVKSREENSPADVLVENTEINCKRKDNKRKKSAECRIGNCLENREILFVEKNGTSGNVNDEITCKKKVETMENIQVEPWEDIENVSVEMGDINPKGRSKANTAQENVTKSEKPLLESTITNNEIPDDIFSSVFKIEQLDDDDDDLRSDLNVNFVSLNSCLLDEDLDEKEQYLHLRELVGTAKEKTELTEETKERLRSLCVLLDFNVPAAHNIENQLCKGPTREQAQQMAALGVKTGRLTRDEDEIIRRNWTSFYKVHDLPNDPTPFLAFKHGQETVISYEDRRKFVQYLGKDLPHRALHSIYRRFKILFKVTKDGRFSQDEDMLILSYVKFSRQTAKFADLMPLLNRSRNAIETRYRVLTKNLTRVSWDLNLKAELIKHMKQVMQIENVSELQHADITHSHLAEVAKRMNLPVVKIRHQWCTKLYTQLFATKPLYLDQMKVDLVDRLYELKLNDWRKVNWCEVAKTFPGVSPVSLRVLMKTLFRHNCPKKLQADLGAIINHCRTITMPELKSRPEFNQRYIYRLKLNKDGGLREYI